VASRLALPALAGAVGALPGVGLALIALSLTIVDRDSPPPLALAGLSPGSSLAVETAVQTVGLMTVSAVAGVILWRQPKSSLSWVIAATVLVLALGVFAAEYAVRGLVVEPASLPLADAAAWSQKVWPDLVSLGAITVILLFPDGSLKSARWRLVLGAATIVVGAHLLAGLDDPYPIWVGLTGKQPVPVTVPPPFWSAGVSLSWMSGALTWLEVAFGLVAGAGVLLRLGGAVGDVRLQLKWFAYAAAVYCLATMLGFADSLSLPDWLPFADVSSSDAAHALSGWGGLSSAFAGMVLLPAAVGVAILRYRLYDIDIVISRTILFGGLAAFVAATYGIVVAGVGSLFGQRAGLSPFLTLLAIALAAASLEPVRARLHRLANVAVYGRRATPYEVLSDFVHRVGGAEPSDILLPRMADLLREGTGAAAVEVWVRVGDRLQLAAASPSEAAHRPAVDGVGELCPRTGAGGAVARVFHEAEQLGALMVVPARGERLGSTERRLLDDLASQAGLVFGRFRLVEELRESRSRIVAAQDLERKRIERNLHDGAQQRFVNALLALGMAEEARSRRSRARELSEKAAAEVRAGLAELRELARGLHPALLAESGLGAAIRGLADRSPIVASVLVADDRRFPEALEVTAYYVVAEALANAAKHSRASELTIRIDHSPEGLLVEVADDGVGGCDMRQGSGLLGLQDRVAAVGGSLTVSSPPGQGTRIRADLPCG
jgi:signal transduction histidine kinase